MGASYASFVPMAFAINRNYPVEKVRRVYAFGPAYVTASNFDNEKYDSTHTHTIYALQFDTLPSNCIFIQVFLMQQFNTVYDSAFFNDIMMM